MTKNPEMSARIKAKKDEIKSLQKQLKRACRDLRSIEKESVKKLKLLLPKGYSIIPTAKYQANDSGKSSKSAVVKTRRKRGEVQGAILEFLKDGKEHKTKEIADYLAKKKIKANVNVTLANMKKKKKVVSTGRATYKIS